MKTILLILNGKLSAPHVADAAINMARSSSSMLHTIFINYKSDLTGYNYLFPNDLSLTMNPVTGKTIAEEDAELLESLVTAFKDECQTANVDFHIEPKPAITLGDVINVSTYSDVIIADAHEYFEEHHIADLLVNAQCPVYLVSRDSARPQNVILAFDGNVSSIHAIKMYSYLFPELRDVPTYLLYIHNGKNVELPHEENIKMWLSRHFSNVQIKILPGDTNKVLVEYTASFPHSLAVMGSYGRNSLSRLFHKSHANAVIEEGKASVFLTHK